MNPRNFDHLDPKGRFTVRLYDQYDGYWIDIKKNLSKDEAIERWNEGTKNGTQYTSYEEGAYYDIFPADTRMIFDSPLEVKQVTC